MIKHIQKLTIVSIILLVTIILNNKIHAQIIPPANGPIGSQLAFGTNEDFKYWNGTVWIAIASGLPGQSLTFSNGNPLWINNPNGITTNTITNITTTTAICGGHISSSSGSPIIARGVCWSTNHNPTITNSHTNDADGKGDFISNISGLTSGNTYYVRSYAINNAGIAYGNEVSFATSYKVVDVDGNSYDTIHVGTQIWLKQNLKTTKYRNGFAIINVTINSIWSSLTMGAYCNYNNDTNYANTYGRLYNWYAVTDSRLLCPTGYHVPTDAEYTALTTYLGGESIAGGKLKEVGTNHWYYPNTNATNETNFSALPCGYRFNVGLFYNVTYNGGFWTSTEYNTNNAWYRYLYYNYNNVDRTYNSKANGYSVRCLKD